MDTTKTQRDNAKKTLMEALKTTGGDTKNKLVVAAIENKSSLQVEN